MAKKQEEQTPSAPDNFPLDLDEFCRRLSTTDKRVELIGGFHMNMRINKRLKDTDQNYRSAYRDFTTRPVE